MGTKSPSTEHQTIPAPRFLLTAPPRAVRTHRTELLIVGGGAAGLAAALRAALGGLEVTLLTRGPLLQSNSAWAQGGIAAALDEADSPHFHVEDTLVAGAGLCDLDAVEALAWEAPDLMREMAALGVPFDLHADGFLLGLEGGHGQRRIVHAGDATGWALTSTLARAAQATPGIHILEGYQAVDLLTAGGRCVGLLARTSEGSWQRFLAGTTLLATGGAGALYGLTSNQPTALGEGIALAYRAGAAVADMEFVQFHPTVFRTPSGHGFLITEAARGEGGLLLTPDGERFMPAYDPRAELAPRDIVSRGIFAAMQRAGSDHVLLDLRHLGAEFLERRFPTIVARCRAEGLDPATAPIPVAPASHYLMGGIRTDLHGRTTLPGLFAAGECACTGVHGANRLASNSLLECLVFGRRAAEAALAEPGSPLLVEAPLSLGGLANPLPEGDWRKTLATTMRQHVSLIREADGLRAALAVLESFPQQFQAPDADAISAANAALVARLIVGAALAREESRGGHFRADFPATDDLCWLVRQQWQRGQPPVRVPVHTPERVAA